MGPPQRAWCQEVPPCSICLLLQGDAAWFEVPASSATAVFVVRLVLMLVGGAGPSDADVDATHPVPTSAFKALSFQSIIAFAMGVGRAGWS